MIGLTPKQQRIWDLKRPIAEGGQGKTYVEIAAIIGISQPVVSKTLTVIYKKLGLKNGRERASAANSIETKNPEKTAALIDAMTDDKFVKIKEAFAAAGLPEAASFALIRRLRVKYTGALSEVRNLKTNEILEMLGNKIHLGLQYLDDKVFSEASARDIMTGLAQLIEKRQLLRGEPTQIISDSERKKLNEILPALIAEGQRRGVLIEGQATVVHEVAP